ncbi:hypothetical protein ACQ4PT_014557 [Festuca glaucescens]
MAHERIWGREDEEASDPKALLEAQTKAKCVRQWYLYKDCVKRIADDETGHKHCTGQYFDYWKCVDKHPSGGSGTKKDRTGAAPASAHPDVLCGSPKSGCRQVGHVDRAMSQRSTQRTWKPWLHLGSTRTRSPGSRSARQMAHAGAGLGPSACPAEYTSVGIARSAFRRTPACASRATDPSSRLPAAAGDIRVLEHRSAHRTIELSPSAQISAHRSTARIITTFASKVLPAAGAPSPAGASCPDTA